MVSSVFPRGIYVRERARDGWRNMILGHYKRSVIRCRHRVRRERHWQRKPQSGGSRANRAVESSRSSEFSTTAEEPLAKTSILSLVYPNVKRINRNCCSFTYDSSARSSWICPRFLGYLWKLSSSVRWQRWLILGYSPSCLVWIVKCTVVFTRGSSALEARLDDLWFNLMFRPGFVFWLLYSSVDFCQWFFLLDESSSRFIRKNDSFEMELYFLSCLV